MLACAPAWAWTFACSAPKSAFARSIAVCSRFEGGYCGGQAAAAPARPSASSPEPAPSRSTRGSGPVKSITVDGAPGSSPPSISAAADEREARLPVAKFWLERLELFGRDLRRFRHDEVPALGRDLRPALPQLDRQTRALDVLARERQGLLGDVDRSDARARVLVRDRERDRARADADVEDARPLQAREQREAPLDDDLRLGPRHERPPVGRERQPPEAPLTEDVGERLPRLAPGEQRLQARRKLSLGSRVERRPRHA